MFENWQSQIAELGTLSKKVNITKDGGIKKTIFQEGTGPKIIAPPTCKIEFHYEMRFTTGFVFDSTWNIKQPKVIRIGSQNQAELIPGLSLGIATMRDGEIAEFEFLPKYAFGEFGCYGRIPPNSTVRVVINVLSFDFRPFYSQKEIVTLDYESKLKKAKEFQYYAKNKFQLKQYRVARSMFNKALSYLKADEIEISNERLIEIQQMTEPKEEEKLEDQDEKENEKEIGKEEKKEEKEEEKEEKTEKVKEEKEKEKEKENEENEVKDEKKEEKENEEEKEKEEEKEEKEKEKEKEKVKEENKEINEEKKKQEQLQQIKEQEKALEQYQKKKKVWIDFLVELQFQVISCLDSVPHSAKGLKRIVSLCTEILNLFPNNVNALKQRGKTRMEINQLKEAQEDLSKAWRLSNGDESIKIIWEELRILIKREIRKFNDQKKIIKAVKNSKSKIVKKDEESDFYVGEYEF
ncbi:inactive peptidyl-prolyl cis-trans isomerase fkbp6 [Anaeramoeba flamelloides]|uniref:peptidylprolyl isomerase n=1 Tax=Anaeramoeba flamelloides TaxID=1746091 RepID=A0AAV7ZCG2_9EUKA|nr:inactive peptidyl-prolyl cis-trans isomerase fkbp6 [Anaeramoeba flamelloides]